MKKQQQTVTTALVVTHRIITPSNPRSYGYLAVGCIMLPALFGSMATPAYAQCAPTSGAVVCSGSNNVTQSIAVNQPTTITTTSGFSVDTSGTGTNAIDISGQGFGPITLTDANNSTIIGAVDGISAVNPDVVYSNTGVGALSITTTGKVTGTTGNGIFAYHAGRLAGMLTINAVDVTGATYGIYTYNGGIGATDITTTGTIKATNGTGISAENYNSATSMTVHAANVTGSTAGILLSNSGAGETELTAGTVTSANGDAINIYNNGNSTGLTVIADTVTGGNTGISAINAGKGSLSITTTGMVTGTASVGILAASSTIDRNGGTDIIVNAVGVKGGESGIVVYNEGKGSTSVTATGPVTGTNTNGILVENNAGTTGLTIDVGAVTGGTTGIQTSNLGSGLTSIRTSGIVEGTSAYGISTTLSGTGDAQITIEASGRAQGATAGILVDASDSSRLATIDNAGTIQNLSAASDALAIQSQEAISAIVNNAGLIQGTVALADGDDKVTNKSGSVWNTAGGTNEFGAGTNAVDNQAGATIIAAGAGATAPVTTRFNGLGTFDNTGTVAMQNGVVGDQVVIAGNYVGHGGTITLDTQLDGDGSPSDLVVLDGGSATGSTRLDIHNEGGAGAETTANGIKVVSTINGATTDAGAFSLAAAVSVNAYDYGLFRSALQPSGTDTEQDWYLRSTGKLNPSSQTALPYADVLGNYAFATLGTLQQRTGNRIWPGGTTPVAANLPAKQLTAYTPGGPVIYGQGAWGRMAGQYSSYDPKSSSSYTQAIGFLQAGYEGVAFESAAGETTVGGYATVGTSTARIDTTRDPVTGAVRAKGRITTTGYGAGVNATWLGNDGFYADAIGQLTWYDSNLSNKRGGNNQGWSSALSLEVGKRFEFDSGWALVPQMQLAWTHVDFDDFTDINGSRVGLGKGDSLDGRIGVRVENLASWKNDTGGSDRLQLYGIVNLSYDFLNGASVEVAGTSITQQNKRLWGEAGLGGNYAWNDEWSAYAETAYAVALSSGSGDNYTVKGTAGLRYKW